MGPEEVGNLLGIQRQSVDKRRKLSFFVNGNVRLDGKSPLRACGQANTRMY